MSSQHKLTRGETLMVAVFLAGTLLAVLNQTLLSPALPSIMRDMSLDAMTAQWLTSGYALVEVVVIPSAAFLIGTFTTRQLFVGGLASFFVGSLLCAWAPSFPVMLAGRALQAVCTGAVMPMVMSVILIVFPRERRGFAMGLVSLTTLPAVVAPEASAFEQLFLGDHFAFVGATAALVVAFVIMVAFVRNGFPARKDKAGA